MAGQGLVYEVAQMVTLDGYKTQGTIHVVINNQVGFTTNYTDSRSATYCTDIAKLTPAPVLHVNADDAEAVVKAMTFALEYRMEFGTDVFVGYCVYLLLQSALYLWFRAFLLLLLFRAYDVKRAFDSPLQNGR